MARTFLMKNASNELDVRKGLVGFSWTTLIFGFFPALFRGDFKWFLVMLLAGMVTFGFAYIIFAFIYNKIYTRSLLERGYKPVDERGKTLILAMNA